MWSADILSPMSTYANDTPVKFNSESLSVLRTLGDRMSALP